MKRSGKIVVLVLVAGFAATGVGTVFADSDEQEGKHESHARYEIGWNDGVSSYADLQRENGMRKEYGDRPDTRFHWKVTHAVHDRNGRLSVLEHVVPLHDMAVFGSVTNGIIANGLKIDRVDAVFNESDATSPEAHYHFTQRFL